MPLPVLFLIEELGLGGTEGHLHDLLLGLDRTRLTPHLIHFADPDGYLTRKLAVQPWLPMTFLPIHRAYDWSGLRAIHFIRRYLRQHDIVVVVTYHFVADFAGTLAAWGTGRPVISCRRDMGFTRNARQLLFGRWLARRVSRTVAVSEAVRQAVAHDERIDPARIEVIPNGTDWAQIERQAAAIDLAPERARLGLRPDELVIGCIANFNPVKGHLTLLEAFARLAALCPDVPLRLLLAGEGPLQGAIEARIAQLGLGASVILAGFSPNPAREFQLSDIIALASETEGFSNSLVQAMALGKPVVACRVGGNPETVENEVTGLLVEPKYPLALAQALARLARDPTLRLQMGQAGHERATRLFSLNVMVERYTELIERVAK